jgi:hypothetical protein
MMRSSSAFSKRFPNTWSSRQTIQMRITIQSWVGALFLHWRSLEIIDDTMLRGKSTNDSFSPTEINPNGAD